MLNLFFFCCCWFFKNSTRPKRRENEDHEMSQTEKPGLPEGALVQLEQQKKVAFFWGGGCYSILVFEKTCCF